MNHIKRLIALLLSVILIFSFSACDGTSKAYIYFSLNEKPITLDPQTAKTDTELMLVRNIFEGLLRKDEDGKIAKGVCESYNKQNNIYTFNLRKDAIWSNEEKITAYDFLFALRRAVDPKTNAPFARRLLSIKNAPEILMGKMKNTSLGVKVIDTYTLKIELSYDDKDFENTLTTSIAMPCNEKFFKECAGKYGLEKDTTLSNGSYRLAKWNKEIFGIRLYRNKFYYGNFVAKNAAVFFSNDNKRSVLQILRDGDCEVGFIQSNEIEKAHESELKTASFENICWFLTISDNFSKGIRKSLLSLAMVDILSQNQHIGYNPVNNIFPPVLSNDAGVKGMPVYDLQAAKKLFSNEIVKLTDKKFPTDVTLYYYDDGNSKAAVTDIVAHWQNQLGAFINIKPVSSPSVLESQLTNQTYAMSIFPITAGSHSLNEYLIKFGINYKGSNLSEVQAKLLSSSNVAPLMTQKTVIAYSDELTHFNFTHGNGCIDFAYVVKEN